VTAELATCLPVLVLLLAVALSAVSVAGQRVRMQDAAREAARAAARGDDATARRLAQQYAPGARVTIDRSGGTVTVVAGGSMHLLARWLRQRFSDTGVYVISLVSSPGAGKTTLLEKTLTHLKAKGCRVAALVGDLATENDAARLARSEVPVRQIITGTVCHLDADMVQSSLDDWDLNDLDCLFIENVGNLVCPSSYDLGEDLRIVLMSVTEGEDKPLKYPTIFNTADVALITKTDLSEAVEFDLVGARGSIQSVRPGMDVIELSAKTGAGLDEYLEYLLKKIESKTAVARV